jgi:hypothetical protein
MKALLRRRCRWCTDRYEMDPSTCTCGTRCASADCLPAPAETSLDPVPSDDELIERLHDVRNQLDPVPQHVIEQAEAAYRPIHELRQDGIPVPVLSDQHPDGAAVLDDSTVPSGNQARTRTGPILPSLRIRWARRAGRVLRAFGWLIVGAIWVIGGIGAGLLFGVLGLLYGGSF